MKSQKNRNCHITINQRSNLGAITTKLLVKDSHLGMGKMRYLPFCVCCSSRSSTLVFLRWTISRASGRRTLTHRALFRWTQRSRAMVELTLVCSRLISSTTWHRWAHLGCIRKWRTRLWHRARARWPSPNHHRLEGAFESRASLPGAQIRSRGPWRRTSAIGSGIWPWLWALRPFCILRCTSRKCLLLGLISLVITGCLRWPAILRRGLLLFCRLALRRFNPAVVRGWPGGWGAPWPVRGWLIRVPRMAPGPWWRGPSLWGPGSGTASTRTVCLPVVLPIGPVVSIATSVILAPRIKASVSPTEIIGPPIASVVASEISILIHSGVIPFSVMSWRIRSGTRPRTAEEGNGEMFFYTAFKK